MKVAWQVTLLLAFAGVVARGADVAVTATPLGTELLSNGDFTAATKDL